MPPPPDQPLPSGDAARGAESVRLETVLRELPLAAVIVAGADGRVVSASARMAELFGDVAVGATVDTLAAQVRGFGADGREYGADDYPIARALRHGEVVAGERIVLERRDGTRVTAEVSASPVHDAAGRRVGGIAVAEDVTARVAAETAERAAAARAGRLQRVTAALAEPLSREQVAQVFAGELPDALGTVYAWLAAVSADGRRFEVLAARDPSGVVPDAWDPIPTDGPTVVAAVYGDGRPRSYASRADLLTASPHLATTLPPGHEAALALPLRSDTRVLAVAWLAFGETREFPAEELAFAEALAAQCASALERARLYHEERALRAEAERQRGVAEAARREAEQASRAKGEFLATMSHELRTPLNAIAGYAQLLDLEMAGPLTPRQREYLTRLSASGQHLLGLVTDVLDLARLDAGQVTVARDPLRLAAAAAGALAVVLPAAEDKRVRLVDHIGADPDAGYLGDEHRVRQVLVNLLANAVKFTPPGGAVELGYERRVTAPSTARVDGRGPWLAVTVRDTGIGIAPDRHRLVFEPFVQAEVGHTRQHDGTGLGLTISRRLARLMGGDITLESAPDVGAAFTLWLPALPSRARADGAREAPRTGGSRRELDAVATRGLRDVSERLRGSLEELVERYIDRLRRDPITAPVALDRSRMDLEDHCLSFLADVVQALAILAGSAASERLMLQDGADVQRLLAERHGRQRQRLGFTAEQLAREYVLLGQEFASTVRRRVVADAEVADAAIATLDRVVRRAAEHAARAYRRAAADVSAGPGGAGPTPDRG